MASQHHIKKRLLIAPLDWGMGHTTRCIPVVRYALSRNMDVWLAGNENQLTLLSAHFPALPTLPLAGYNISYQSHHGSFAGKILSQVPGILTSIRREQKWLAARHSQLHFDGVISDNRYGLHLPGLPSAILTHQLQLATGAGRVADWLLSRRLRSWLSRFSETWIADTETPALAGKLSHPARLPANARYAGLLSQFDAADVSPSLSTGPLVVLLSGPEPQRSILSDLLWAQLPQVSMPVVFVEGKSGVTRQPPASHIRHHDLLAGSHLESLLHSSTLVLCRSGYSSIMDLVKLRKPAVLIPTPGQGEQQYLAHYLAKEGLFTTASQHHFQLAKTLAAAKYKEAHTPQQFTAFSDAHFQAFHHIADAFFSRL